MFRLIVVAERDVVMKKFPIPLINRLEKHTLTMQTMLSPQQQHLAQELEMWAKEFLPKHDTSRFILNFRTFNPVSWRHLIWFLRCLFFSLFGPQKAETSLGDIFIGYENDTAASIVLQTSQDRDVTETEDMDDDNILERCKFILLQVWELWNKS